MADDSQGVELLRKAWEIDDHWMLRRDFMIAHKDKFAPDRLLCLAQIFVNVETLGTQYSEEVMNENERLGEEVPCLKEFRRKKLRLQTEERFKAPPKAKNNNANDVGSRNVTHDRYQSYQQNYSQSRQDKNQYQDMHGYGRRVEQQQQFSPSPVYGRSFVPQPVSQQTRYDHQSYPPYQQPRQMYRPQHQPTYGRNAVTNQQPQHYSAYGQSGQQQQQQHHRQQQQSTPTFTSQTHHRQDHGSGWGQSGNERSGGSTAYSSMLLKNQRR